MYDYLNTGTVFLITFNAMMIILPIHMYKEISSIALRPKTIAMDIHFTFTLHAKTLICRHFPDVELFLFIPLSCILDLSPEGDSVCFHNNDTEKLDVQR